MRIEIENIGILDKAEFEVGDLTIICGKNNTGKTYATYALYGFLKLWRAFLTVFPNDKHSEELLSKGVTRVDLSGNQENFNSILSDACEKYTKFLHKVFASKEDYFEKSKFNLYLDDASIPMEQEFRRTIKTKEKDVFYISKEKNEKTVEIVALQEKEMESLSKGIVEQLLNDIVIDMFFEPLFPKVYISTAERSGAAIFRSELDFARNKLLEGIGNQKEIDPFKLIFSVMDSYSLPVRENVDFIRNLDIIQKEESFISKEHKEIIKLFQEIIGGDYKIAQSGAPIFIPKEKRSKRLNMGESSSAINTMLDINYYLKHVLKPGDILFVDEPEINLHPQNQRKIARLFARLANAGVKVFVTTHSDYLIKEFNSLIMFGNNPERTISIAREYGYDEDEFLHIDKIRAYSAGMQKRPKAFKFVECNISQRLGIEIKDFDEAIVEMNEIQEAILFGDNGE